MKPIMQNLWTLLAILCLSISASAYDFSVDGIYYNITDASQQTVAVTYNNSKKYSGKITVLDEVQYNSKTYSVTSIGASAFYDCSDLTAVTIPNSVTSIGDYSFYRCSGLTSVSIPSSVTVIGSFAFYYCYQLKKFTIEEGDSQLSFGSNALDYARITDLIIDRNWYYNGSGSICTEIKNVTLGKKVTQLPNKAFYGCSNLTSVTIPCSVTSIGNSAFYRCTGLTSVVIPNSVTSIRNGAFEECSGLTSITIPNSVTSIGNYTFEGCSGLTSVTIPNSVTSIGDGAFSGCSSLTSVIIPKSVTSIGSYAFSNCFGLVKSACPSTIGNPFYSGYCVRYDHNGSIIEDGFIYGPEKLSILFVPHSLNGEYTIPNSVTSIGDYAFSSCSDLTSVIIPNSVTSIGNDAFAKCSSLTSVTIPNAVTSIGYSAFNECTNLKDVITHATEPPSITDDTFAGLYSMATLSVPKNSIDSYLSSKWTLFSSLKFIGEDSYVNTYSDGLLSYYILPVESDAERRTAFVKKGNYKSMTSVVIPERFTDDNSNRYYITGIGYDAFNGCTALKEVKFNAKCAISTIGDNAFKGTPITSIELPSTVTSIGNTSFYGCSGLTSITLPNSLTSIGNSTFYKCTSLNSITIPKSVTSIGNSTFYKCTSLTSVDISNSVTLIDDFTFYGCTGLSSVTLSNSVTSIGNFTFYGCTGLTSEIIPNSVTSIGASAFADCKLTEVVLPPSVEAIGRSAFAGNSGLNKIAMGCKVKTIDENAFQGANADSVFITAQVPPKAPISTFSRYAGKLYVQGKATVDAYYDALGCWDRFEGYAMSEPQSLTLEKPKSVEGTAGERFTLKATLTPADVDLPYIFWRSTNPEKVYVDNNGAVTVLQDIAADEDVKIIAETLYANGSTAEFSFSDIGGIEDVAAESADESGLVDAYNLQGVMVLKGAQAAELKLLAPGIYIVRQGSKTTKITIR